MFRPVELTADEKYMMEVARVGLMSKCPFFAHYFYSEMKERPTRDVPTAGTDGRNIFFNPDFFAKLSVPQQIFVLAHEVHHVICQHPRRKKLYMSEDNIQGVPYDEMTWQRAMDYVINADLVETKIGEFPEGGCLDPKFKGTDLCEDVYKKLMQNPPPPGRSGKGNGTGKGKGKAPAFEDEVLEPSIDPVTGREDLPDEHEFQEAIARAAAAAKAMGNMPGFIQRLVDEILEPQIQWREHLRMLVTGHVGRSRETWTSPNRRRLVLNPQLFLPGQRGNGANIIAVVVDNSGSIGERELSLFFAEVSGILADVRPREVVLIWCDAKVQQVDQARSLDELTHIRTKGSPGGGGTSFIPPFEWLAENAITPDALVYVTDGYGEWGEKPAYPTIWCMSTDVNAPWGDVVRIKV